jgi:hypothetical protein
MNDATHLADSLRVIETFFGALRAAQWDSAAGMIDPDMAISVRDSELASLIA